jgi:hypothetical protein
MLCRPGFAPFHKAADRRRSCVENRHSMTFNDVPEPIRLRVVRRSFIDEHRCSVEQRTIDDVGVTRDPADIGRAEVGI